VGSRLHAEKIAAFIRSPQQRKGGTLMPGMFADGAAAGPQVGALAAYLASLQEDTPATPGGDTERGKQLYHSVGCVACHAPETGFRPAGAAEGQEIPQPKHASVPLALATDYDAESLAHFLLDPRHYRPGGRMPSMRLSAQEAADLAAYLHPASSEKKRSERTAIDPGTVAKGRELFAQQRCSACHSLAADTPPRMARPLPQLSTDDGCLAPAQMPGIPSFNLSEVQRRALRLAMVAVRSGPPAAQTVAEKIDHHFSRSNCYACHARNGKGGPEPARAVYFTTNDPGAESLGEFAHLPPALDKVGRKLTREWLARILWGEGGSVRPYMNTRMPDFGQAQTEALIPWLEEADALAHPPAIDVSGLLGHQRAAPGRQLLGTTGLGCVSCHGLKDRKSPGPPVIRLTHTVARLRPEYFKELLLDPPGTQPGTLMPPLFAGRKAADKEIESIWTYLKEVDSQPLPEGLFSDADYELKPAAAGRPIVLRSFIEGSGTHAIGVGFPQGLNASFDAKNCRWAMVWKGRFLDALSNWQDRAMKPIKPLGTEMKMLPGDATAREFRGYRLEKNGVPVMLYLENGAPVEDKLEPAADGKSFEHLVTRAGVAAKEVLSW
jgi:cytochrome c2